MHTIGFVGTIALGILEDGEPWIDFPLEEGQEVPPEFKVGDEVKIHVQSTHPAMIAMGVITGYYDVEHVASGKTLRIMHSMYEYMFKKDLLRVGPRRTPKKMDCTKTVDLKKQLAASTTEEERLRLQAAIKDHNKFWHPHNCE